MNRMQKFNSYENHPWFKRLTRKLSQRDRVFCIKFIEMNDHLNKRDFEIVVNRMFLDREKPKAWKEISELIACCNC